MPGRSSLKNTFLQISKVIHPVADLPLSSRHRVSQVTFHPTHPFLAVQSHDRSVEIFRIRTEEEVLKKQARRRKRAKDKEGKTGSAKDDARNVTNPEVDPDITLVDLFTPHLIVRASGKICSFAFGGNNVGPTGAVRVRGVLKHRKIHSRLRSSSVSR